MSTAGPPQGARSGAEGEGRPVTSAAQSLLHSAPRALAGAGAVGSPCVSVCRMDADGLCEGCLRSLDEIGDWSDMDDAERRAVWRRILQRAHRVTA